MVVLKSLAALASTAAIAVSADHGRSWMVVPTMTTLRCSSSSKEAYG
jgi:hypothetical protein